MCVLHARDVALIATIGVPAHVRLFGSIYTPGSTRGHHPFPLAPIFLVLDFPSFAFLFVIVQFTAKKKTCGGAMVLQQLLEIVCVILRSMVIKLSS